MQGFGPGTHHKKMGQGRGFTVEILGIIAAVVQNIICAPNACETRCPSAALRPYAVGSHMV